MPTQDSPPEITTDILDASVIVTPDSPTDIPLSRFTFTPTGWPYPTNLTNVNGSLYFTADDSTNGKELWKIDPTGTAVRVTDINPGANSSEISNLTNVDGTLYFHTYDSIHGRELWKIDPTGTAVLVNDINPFAESTLTNVNGNIYFTANKSINGSELWKINATGTAVLVTDFSSGTNSSYLSNLTSINGMLYFIATNYIDSISRQKLCKLDNIGNIIVVKDFNTGTTNTSLTSGFTNVNGTNYFVTNTNDFTNSTSKGDLWKIDSTGNVVLVPNLSSGTESSYISNLTNINGTLYFTANGSTDGEKLWKVANNGDPVFVKNLSSSAELYHSSNLTNVDGILYFTVRNSTNENELWKIDDSGNPVFTGNINDSSYLYDLTNVNGILYFTAYSTTNGKELWKVNSTGNPTLVKDINLTYTSGQPSNVTKVNGILYFTTSDATNGEELWKVNSSGNAELVKDINPGADSSQPSDLTNINDTLYFTAYNTTTGRELWKIDDTGNAVLVQDINPGGTSSDPIYDRYMAELMTRARGGPVDNSPSVPGSTAVVDLFNNNMLETTSAIKGVSIQAISQKQTNKVNEIGFFNVDDRDGKIDGIRPGEAGYIKAAIDRAKSILTTLGGNFFNTEKQEIGLDPNKIYQFFEVENGSLADVKQQLAKGENPTNIRLSIFDANGNSPIKVTGDSIQSGYNISINNDELVLKVTKLDGIAPNRPIGSESQGKIEGRIIDLTKYKNQSLTVDITTKSDAIYQSQIGFYVVKDAMGTIELADGTTVKPGDANYAMIAIKDAIANAGLQSSRIDRKTNQPITGGRIYAPVVVTQGTMNDFVNNPSKNSHAYFNYVNGNTDKVDHFRQIGANTFGVEDMYGGGDRDFNDIVIQMNIKTA
jgi:ELWxxDGT repeat protein